MHKTLHKILLTAILVCGAVTAARADGEQRFHESGTEWVDPVEFYHLQDINRTDLQRDYDQGDIDFNKVLKEKGVKVYGLRLKPFAGAFYVDKFMSRIAPPGTLVQLDHQDLYGIKGIPIHEAGFCVYFDESVSRSYTIDCNVAMTFKDGLKDTSNERHSIKLNGIRLVHSDGGLGFSYALHSTRSGTEHYTTEEGKDKTRELDIVEFHKPDGVNARLGHFIYFKGARDLLVMLSCVPGEDNAGTDAVEALANRPWTRVYFIVEQILVETSAAVAEEAAITGSEPEVTEEAPKLSDEDKTELKEYMEDLFAWLSGEGDPLGLGEHADPTETAVINTIATLASILLGTGIAGVVGGTGASIASGMTSAILSGAAGSTPPPAPNMPNSPQMDGLKPKRPEEEEDEGTTTPPAPPVDPSSFVSSNYPELSNQFVRQDADGDIYVKDPVTGQETLYTNNGDGTYRNITTNQDWTPDEIGERLRERSDNYNPLKQDADLGARNAAEQHAQWVEKESKEVSKLGQEYLQWKHEQEAAEKKQEEIEKLAEKYHVAATEKAVKEAIEWEQLMNEMDSRIYNAEAEAWHEKKEYLQWTERMADFGVNVLGNVAPGGGNVKNAYTFAKSTLVGFSEAMADGKSFKETMRHMSVRMGEGALGVIQNEAGNLSGGWKGEYGITVGTEFLKSGMKEYNDSGGDLGKAIKAGLGGVGSSTVSFGVGKAVSAGFTTLKDGAKDYVKYGKNGLVPKDDAAYTIESTLHKFLNGTRDYKVGTKNVYFQGIVNKGNFVETIVTETIGVVKYGPEEDEKKNIYELTGGQYMEDMYDFVKEIHQLPKTAAKYAKANKKN